MCEREGAIAALSAGMRGVALSPDGKLFSASSHDHTFKVRRDVPGPAQRSEACEVKTLLEESMPTRPWDSEPVLPHQ
jgi:hypothetical protein